MTSLLVCCGGGHLKQLHQLRPRFAASGVDVEDVVWVTYDSPLSRSLLAGEEVIEASYFPPRDAVGVLRNARLANRVLSARRFDTVISTGARLALSFMPLARARGIPCHYIESAARATGPSLTGRLIRGSRTARTYTQYQAWESAAWHYRGSVFDGFRQGPRRVRTGKSDPLRIVVTLGTEKFGFRRLVESALAVIPPGSEVMWQTGATDLAGLDVPGRRAIPYDELEKSIADADVVLSHAGCGAALTALEAGKLPILVPRSSERGEHIDDHQSQVARELEARGLALLRSPENLVTSDLEDVAAKTVERSAPPEFPLDSPRGR